MVSWQQMKHFMFVNNFFTLTFLFQQELTDHLNSPVIFAHNDLLSGNVMINNEEGIDITL